MPSPMPWTSYPTYVNAMLQRSRTAVRRVGDAVEERWQQTNAGEIPLGHDVAELAATAGLPNFTVKHISLLIDLHKKTLAMVNESIVRGPWSAWDLWFFRREVRKAVKIVERNASAILKSLGEPTR
ncbi:hypothetical protein ABGB07_33965 [Micromonosporaceae bacterium B7E4]